MSKTLSLTLSASFGLDTVTVRAKKSSYDPLVYRVSKRQLIAAAKRLNIDHNYLTLHKVPSNTDYWLWEYDGSFSIRMHDRT